MNDIIFGMIQNTEAAQAAIMSWVDFLWSLAQHPLVSMVLGALGYGVARDIKPIAKGTKRMVTKKGNKNEG